MNFIGNKKAVDFLKKSIEKDNVSHAYIFSGPENVGKFLLAKIFSQAIILGEDFNTEEFFEKQESKFDLIIVEPEIIEKKGIKKESDIKIENIREAMGKLSTFPYHGRKKIMIVNNAHKMNISSQNALLKTLEEPNSTSMIILITHESGKLLPTIASRCLNLNFSLLNTGEYPMGRPGLFFAEKEGNVGVEDNEYSKNLAEKLKTMSIGEKLKEAENLSRDIVRAMKILNFFVWNLRMNGNYAEIEKVERALELLKSTNSNARIVLEKLFLEI